MPKMRLGWYVGASTALAATVLVSAFHRRPNFYSSMVYLSQSNFCLLVMVNFTLFVYSSMVYGLTRLCFGRLRPVETEQLTERAWFAVTETCLAMTVFRDEIGGWFLVMFVALVTGKVWGWIGDARIEVLEQQPPANPRLFHTRLSISLALSCLYDLWLLRYTAKIVGQKSRPSMMAMFLFEFAVLTTTSWRTAARYILTLVEQNITKKQMQTRLKERREEVRQQREAMIQERQRAADNGEEPPENQEPLPNPEDIEEMDIEVPGWAAKGEWVLWLDLIADMIKLSIYCAFFYMLTYSYGLPIHIMRDIFLTTRDFIKRLGALLRYRRAMREMNRHPDATQEDLDRENTCIICREEMKVWDPENDRHALDRVRPKKLPCGHILHLGCLKSWLERQQVCPTCRTPVSAERTAGGPNRAALRIQIGGPAQGQQQLQQQPPAQPVVAGPANAVNGVPQQNVPQGQQPNPQPPQPGQEPQGDGARVFNFGPIRLGFGANAQQVRDLAQQFGMPFGLNNNQGQGQAQAQAPVTPQPQQPGMPQAQALPQGDGVQNIASLLQQADGILQRELHALQASQQELQTMNLLMMELQRLRQRQQHQQDPGPNGPVQPGMPMGLPMLPNFPPPQHFAMPPPPVFNQFMPLVPPFPAGAGVPRPAGHLFARHGAAPNTTAIPSGSPDLPEGVTLPAGWSLMPLHRLDEANGAQGLTPTPTTRVNEPRSTNGEATVDSHEPALSHGSSVQVTDEPVPVSDTAATMQPPPPPSQEISSPADPASVVAPSPMMPNWGGSAQLFSSGPRMDQGERPTPTSDGPSRSTANTLNGHGSSSMAPADGASSSVQQAQSEQPETSAAAKSKAHAVTVEEAEDDDEDKS